MNAPQTGPQRIHVLGIDWQVDFCSPTGNLYVAGADADSQRMAKFINRVGPRIEMFHMTLDSHQEVHIAHPIMWRGRDGAHPAPFTTITVDDVRAGTWRASDPMRQAWYLQYVESLKANARYDLMIWPPHCLIGQPGHNIMPEISAALSNWSKSRLRMVNYVTKGSHPDTEHYSAMQADVPVPTDPSTKLNTNFLKFLQRADRLIITGQASSHCVANTVRDIAANFSSDEVRKFTIVKDLMSPVPPAKGLADKFLVDMAAMGVTIVDDSSTLLA